MCALFRANREDGDDVQEENTEKRNAGHMKGHAEAVTALKAEPPARLEKKSCPGPKPNCRIDARGNATTALKPREEEEGEQVCDRAGRGLLIFLLGEPPSARAK